MLTGLFVDSISVPRRDFVFHLHPRPTSRGKSRRVWTGAINKLKGRSNREDTSTHRPTHGRARSVLIVSPQARALACRERRRELDRNYRCVRGKVPKPRDISTHGVIASHPRLQQPSVWGHLDRIRPTSQRWDNITVVLTVMGWPVAARRGRRSVPIGGFGVRVHS